MHSVIRTQRTKISIAVFCISLLTITARLQAQEVRGRLISAADSTPVVQGLLLLLDESGQEKARTVTAPSGGFELHAPAPGRYRLRVQRIGQRGWKQRISQLAAVRSPALTLTFPYL